ncbi:MerR family transcriptional regulator [Planococcus salinarum]|uniref:MerR family transcriptional regulator n=1 Tax=Planococcus salinarum TaxID=622695 RepID=A0ABX3D232_9BACL|nr:MerR family transcriptional regulator [Planococcus salinarum]OHX52153.1 MerR family transcriptional regulator [Planococcus salinarum]TAA73459.1 MerR family transcriptional regulator [Planococcus salinarum]
MYNIKAAAKILDMPKVTIRSWETRYNAITPARTESGHRLYSDQNLEDLQWLKIQVQENGIKISEAVKLLHASRKKFVKPASELPPSPEGSYPYKKQIEELYNAGAEMDSERFQYLLDLNFSMFHYRTVFFSILAPLMVRIGEEWENGTITVAHEHMLSHLVLQRFTQFFRIFPTSENLPKALAFCPSGEHHQLGLLLFTLFLREHGYSVAYIGPDTPLEGLPELVEKQDFKLVCMSIGHERLLPAAEKYISTLNAVKPDLQFVIGGRGLGHVENKTNEHYLGTTYEEWQRWLDDTQPKRA